MGRLTNKVGLVTGAARGIGEAIARRFVREGASVILSDIHDAVAIRCNSVHPAAILTPMWDAMLGAGEDRERRMAEFVRDTPLRRFGTVEEVAQAVIYLASDESRYTTGIELVLDGGLLAGSAATPKQ